MWRSVLSVVVPFGVGVAAANWTSLHFWADIKEGLIAFLGFVAAALVQVMPVTANFLQSDRLKPTEAERLTKSLTKQQHYWAGLLWASIVAMVIVIVGSAMADRHTSLRPILYSAHLPSVGWGAVICFSIAAATSFVMFKVVGLVQGILALHRLRVELVLLTASREAEERQRDDAKAMEHFVIQLPKGYGEVIQHH